VQGIVISRIDDGKIVEDFECYDTLLAVPCVGSRSITSSLGASQAMTPRAI
jgi:hypothetical protein